MARKGEQPAITDVMFCSVFGLRNRHRVVTRTNEVLCQANCTGESVISVSRAAEPLKKRYSPPTLVKRSREQATLLLVGHASIGDSAARDLLELLFPEQAEKEDDISDFPSPRD